MSLQSVEECLVGTIKRNYSLLEEFFNVAATNFIGQEKEKRKKEMKGNGKDAVKRKQIHKEERNKKDEGQRKKNKEREIVKELRKVM